MTNQDAIRDFMSGGGAKAFPFESIGDGVEGEVVDMDLRQQTDLNTGEPKFWPDGRARMVLVITLQTELSDDEDDDGQRTVWIRGGNFSPVKGTGASSLNALRDAEKRAGGVIEIGGHLSMTYTGDAKPSTKGFTGAKCYEAAYKAPSRNVSLDELA